MATKISQATWDAIGKQIVKDAGGIKALTDYVVSSAYDVPQGNFGDWCRAYIHRGAVWYATDDRAWQLDKFKIPYRNVDKKFEEVYGQATQYLVYHYLKKHGLMIETIRKPYGRGYTLDFKLVKDPYAKPKKKTAKKTTAKRRY